METRAPIRPINAILIHGIGNPKPGSIKCQAKALLVRAGVPEDHVYEFNWNEHVLHPVTRGFLSPRGLSELSEALLNSAWFGFEGESRILKLGAVLFELSLGLFPLVIATLVLERYPGAVRWIVPEECCESLRSFPNNLVQSWVSVVACIAGLMVAIAAFYRSQPFLAALRRILLISVWPLVHLLLLPFLIPWHLAALVAVATFTRSCVSYRMDSISQPSYWLEIFTALGLLLLAAVLAVGALVGAGLVAPPLKLIADIIRYLGLPTYRNRLHEHLRELVSHIDDWKESRILLIGHSLGSVIAIDFLLDPRCPIDRNADISLITLGSPLQRFFTRFFGQAYAPPAEIAKSIRYRFPAFFWINIFRPFDYVGSRLAAPEPYVHNICTDQRFRSHSGYWRDEIVAVKAEDALRNRALCDLREASIEPVRIPFSAGGPARYTVPRWACLFLVVTSVGYGSGYLGYLNFRLMPARYQREKVEARIRIDRDPVDVAGVLRRKFGAQHIGPPESEQYQEYEVLELTFTPHGAGSSPMTVRSGRILKSDPSFSGLKWNANQAPIRVRYLRNHPEDFYSPDEDLGDPKDTDDPWLAGLYGLFFRAAPLGALTYLIFVTLYGLLRPKGCSEENAAQSTVNSSQRDNLPIE